MNFSILRLSNLSVAMFTGLSNGIILAIIAVYLMAAGAQRFTVYILGISVLSLAIFIYGFSPLGDVEKSIFSNPIAITIIIGMLSRYKEKQDYESFSLRKQAEAQKDELEVEVVLRKKLQKDVESEARKNNKLFSVLSGVAGNLKIDNLYADIQNILIENFTPDALYLYVTFDKATIEQVVSYNSGMQENPVSENDVRKVMNENEIAYMNFDHKTANCLLGIPVTGAQNCLGVLFIGGYDNELCTIYDGDFFLSLGRQLGLVLENALFYEKIEKTANEDPLTGLANRRAADQFIEKEISRYQRYKQKFCVALLDLDHFKQVNDTYGHDVGDEVLKKSAHLYHDTIRATDFAARWGGEEFLLVFIGCDISIVGLLLERLRHSQAALRIKTGASSVLVTVSIGAVEYEEGESLAECIKRADESLYKAKSRGRNCVVIE